MKICIPIEFKPHGGGYYFLQMFEDYLQALGWLVTRDVNSRADVLFTNHWMTPRREILKAIRANPHLRIVQRIDGAAQDYGRDPEADRLQQDVNRLADLTIFQSEYCRFSTREKFGVIRQDGPVIHNPVDTEVFSPVGVRRNLAQPCQVACVTWSANILKGAQKIYEVARDNQHIHFALCGNYQGVPDLPNLHKQGVLDRGELAETLRSCQVLLTFSQNEACPNHVLEALACGLPILYEDSGAMQEVIADSGLPVTVQTFRSQFEKISAGLNEKSRRARERATTHFYPGTVFPRYIEEINRALKEPIRLQVLSRQFLAWKDYLIPFHS